MKIDNFFFFYEFFYSKIKLCLLYFENVLFLIQITGYLGFVFQLKHFFTVLTFIVFYISVLKLKYYNINFNFEFN